MSNTKLSSRNSSKIFPDDVIPKNKKLLPKEINWFELRNAIDIAGSLFCEGKWSEGNVMIYLSTLGINANAS